jgi:hypothetical protein
VHEAMVLNSRGNDAMNKTWTKALIGGLALVGVVGFPLAGVRADYTPVANLTEKFDGSDANWALLGDGTKVVNGDSIAVQFDYQNVENGFSMPDQWGDLFGNDAASAGRFVGDYTSAGSKITDVTFDVKRDGGTAKKAKFVFESGNGDVWYRDFALPVQDGVWTPVTIALTFSPDWIFSGAGVASADLFAADLADVTGVAVEAMRGGTDAQKINVDNFKVVGPWGGPAYDGLPASWLQEYGLGVGAGHATEDADGDGCNNLTEFLAGTSPTDATSYFYVDIGRNAQGEPVLKWKHEAGRSFTVKRSLGLDGTFNAVQSGILSAAPKNELVVKEGGEGPFFYKVEIEQP